MALDSCERYWKDRTLFDVRFSSPLHADGIAQATFETLRLCQTLMGDWTVAGPYDFADGQWEFRGSSRNVAEGIVLIDFSVDNFFAA